MRPSPISNPRRQMRLECSFRASSAESRRDDAGRVEHPPLSSAETWCLSPLPRSLNSDLCSPPLIRGLINSPSVTGRRTGRWTWRSGGVVEAGEAQSPRQETPTNPLPENAFPSKSNQTVGPGLSGANPPPFFLRKRGGLVGNGGYPQAATAFHALGRARAYPNAFQQMPNYFFLSFDVHSYRRFSFPKQGLDSITNGILKKHILARDAVIS